MKQALWLRHESGSLRWSLVFLVILGSLLVAFGFPLVPILFFSGLIVVLFAYSYPYAAFALMVGLIPFSGLFVHIPAGFLPLGNVLFGGSIDVLFGEIVAVSVCLAWVLRVLFLWYGRNDIQWKPWIPLFLPIFGIFLTHLLSAFSVFQPDALLVVKYALRPVLWSYLLYVLLTVNLIRSQRRLKMVFGTIVFTGVCIAFIGFISLWFSQDPGQILPRAKPLSLFGAYPLGDNHNQLAEWLSITAPYTFALIYLVRSARVKRLLFFLAGFQIFIGLLTFARSIWIVFALEAFLFAWLLWRHHIRKWIPQILLGAVLLSPLIALMIWFSSSALVASSTSTRMMMTEISMSTWLQSPLIGAGAGTFEDRIAATALFTIEFGAPLDSHGWIQKLLAEVGLIGLLAVVWFFYALYRFIRPWWESVTSRGSSDRKMLVAILLVTVVGSLVYQLFNTSYWTGKLWLPIGILLAAYRIFYSSHRSQE